MESAQTQHTPVQDIRRSVLPKNVSTLTNNRRMSGKDFRRVTIPSLQEALLERVEGSDGLAKVLAECKPASPSTLWVVILDFDRTLTTGFAKPEGEDEIVKDRIRGGQVTVDALESAKAAGAALHIVTARRASPGTIESIFASLDRSQSHLSSLFDRGDGIVETKFLDTTIAYAGRVYASDYNKPTAIAHMLSRMQEQAKNVENVNVLFVDDACVNPHQVQTLLAERLHASGLVGLSSKIRLRSVWWDPIQEDLEGPNQSMRPVDTSSSDFNYHEHLGGVLEAYSLDETTRLERMRLYETYEKKNGKSVAAIKPLPKPKKLSISNKFASLASVFARPPPSSDEAS